MSDAVLDQIVEMAFKLTIAEQAELLQRVAAHLAHEVHVTQQSSWVASMANKTYEVWSLQDEGGAVTALQTALEEHKKRKRSGNAK